MRCQALDRKTHQHHWAKFKTSAFIFIPNWPCAVGKVDSRHQNWPDWWEWSTKTFLSHETIVFAEDFICTRRDTNSTRLRQKSTAKLKRKMLKPTAVPRYLPNCPRYLSSTSVSNHHVAGHLQPLKLDWRVRLKDCLTQSQKWSNVSLSNQSASFKKSSNMLLYLKDSIE